MVHPGEYYTPRLSLTLQFSKGMTALSLFVPLIATVFAFWFIGYEMEIPLWRIVISGVFVGLTSGSCLK